MPAPQVVESHFHQSRRRQRPASLRRRYASPLSWLFGAQPQKLWGPDSLEELAIGHGGWLFLVPRLLGGVGWSCASAARSTARPLSLKSRGCAILCSQPCNVPQGLAIGSMLAAGTRFFNVSASDGEWCVCRALGYASTELQIHCQPRVPPYPTGLRASAGRCLCGLCFSGSVWAAIDLCSTPIGTFCDDFQVPVTRDSCDG